MYVLYIARLGGFWSLLFLVDTEKSDWIEVGSGGQVIHGLVLPPPQPLMRMIIKLNDDDSIEYKINAPRDGIEK